jgi:solute carrier family 25 (mitochondrial phosphate transporter), member 23/24/25/41
MVLRGSKVRPESTLEDSEAAVTRARAYLRQAQRDLKQAQNTQNLKRALTSIERRESSGEKVSPDELKDIVRVLLEKLDALEENEKIGKQQVIDAERRMRDTVLQLAAGGAAGAIARTFVAPIDRVKILMQTQHVVRGTSEAPKYLSLRQSLRTIIKDEGVARLWRGNGVNCIRVVPYSGFQFASYDKIKSFFINAGGVDNFGVPQRLSCGAGAAVVATCATYPLDMVRLRLSVQPELRGVADSVRSILAEGGPRSFFKGFIPTVCSITPFVAINFATFDTIKTTAHVRFPSTKDSIPATLSMGAMSGLFAQTCCYPLDLVRRRMQLKGHVYSGVLDALKTIARDEGFRGFYKGMVPNAVKVVPNTALRFMAYDVLKKYLGIEGKKKDR